jgi:hypothetical protein
MKERRRLIELDDSRKVICATPMRKPWVQLIEIVEGRRTPLPFPVEDGRLANPTETLARLALDGREFKPFKYVSATEKASIPRNVVVEVTPLKPSEDNGMDES